MVFVSLSLQQGHRQDSMSDTFWLMTFFESASFIGSQVFANWLVGDSLEKNIVSPSTAAIFLAMISIICFTRGLKGTIQTPAFKEYRMSFNAYIFGGKSPIFLIKSILSFLLLKQTISGQFQNGSHQLLTKCNWDWNDTVVMTLRSYPS